MILNKGSKWGGHRLGNTPEFDKRWRKQRLKNKLAKAARKRSKK